MGLRKYIKRGVKYIVSGTPIVKVEPNLVQLGKSELLKGKVALVTGGTSGIGKSIATAFVNSGAHVYITGRNKERVDKAVIDINTTTNTDFCQGIELDNSNIEKMNMTLNKIHVALPNHSFDILVNNAGLNGGILSTCDEEEFQKVLDTNLKGTIFLTRIIYKNMIDSRIQGNILNICSSSSIRPANTAYVLSKWGLRGYTLGLAKQLIKYGIVVNGLAPGPTATPMLLKDTSDISLPNNPSGRFALPEEIANLAVVLTSELGRMVVGDILYATGGAGIITYDDIKY